MKKIILITLLLFCSILFSQQKNIVLNWDGYQTMKADTYSVTVPHFLPKENFDFNIDQGVFYVNQWISDLPVNENTVTLNNLAFQTVSREELKGLKLSVFDNYFILTAGASGY